MQLKCFELRDKATFIPVFAFRARPVNEPQRYLLSRAGFGPEGHSECVIFGRLDCSGTDRNCTYDPYAWGGRSYPVAHQYIEQHFDELPDGAVIDVEFILGESTTPKLSEAVDPFDEMHGHACPSDAKNTRGISVS